MRYRKQVFQLVAEREIKVLIEFYKKKTLKNKKDKKISNIFKGLNLM